MLSTKNDTSTCDRKNKYVALNQNTKTYTSALDTSLNLSTYLEIIEGVMPNSSAVCRARELVQAPSSILYVHVDRPKRTVIVID